MNYSRRQLEALGETLGECVTRKEGGRIIYGGGGGGGSTGTQTQITELPEWAKPYAQETLEKTKALTATPYQAYGQPRIAGFSPLQEQAHQAAAGMKPSELGQFGGQLAGAATMGALGTSYDPYQTGQFTSGAAAQYMNPFVEQAMAPQLREAQRASEIQGQAEQAQAVRAGAFGGSRQAIVEAERQRNLGQQLGDIRARGYMSAFDRAQDQFAREQQLREQSRQYGAGLGLQGLQTALQGAGQMGALGQQQFGQEMDINRLQQQVGAQQQALRQQGLTQAYQDFLNEQNYPYKQLGFMSDMIRGLPLGQQSTRQLYEPPGSMVGQLGGLGMGLYGMSRAFGGFADGGEVEEYAEGGDVTSDEFIRDTLAELSDAQLAQSELAATNEGDQAQLDMIKSEKAKRASLRAGLGSAFNMLPEKTQSNIVRAASGGVVAFSNGGINPEFDVGDPTAEGVRSLGLNDLMRGLRESGGPIRMLTETPRILRGTSEAVGRTARGGKSIEETYGEPAFPSKASTPVTDDGSYAALEQKRLGAQRPRQRSKPEEKTTARAAPSTSAPVRASISDLAKQLDVPEKPLVDEFTAFQEAISTQSAERLKKYAEAVEKATGGSKEVKEKALGAALAEFGFKWAASAAKPGARFLSSLAEASPTLASSMAQSAKLAREMDQNDQRLRLNVEQLRLAEANNDSRTAMQLTTQNRVLRQAQQENALRKAALDEQIRSNTAKEGLMRSRIAAAGPAAVAKASAAAIKDYGTAQNNALNRAERRAAKDFSAAMLNPELQKSYIQRGITTPAHLYQLYVQEELQRLTKQYVQNPVPDESDDEDEA